MTVDARNPGIVYVGGNPVEIVSLLTPDATPQNSPKSIGANERRQVMLADPLTGEPYDLVSMIAAGGGGTGITANSTTTFRNKTIDSANNTLLVAGVPIVTAIAAAVVQVIDNTTSSSTTAALSANQGLILETEFQALLTQFQQFSGDGAITTTNDSLSTNEDVALTGNVLANDTTTSGTLSVTQYVVSGVSGIQAVAPGGNTTTAIPNVGSINVASTGAFTFTPAANFNGAMPTINYQCTNGTATASGNLNVTVVPVNDAPIARSDASSTLQNTPVTINVLANDSDLDADTLTITQINGTTVASGGTVTIANASVTLNANKTLTFTPNTGITGAQTFSYTVSDGHGGTAVANVTITVVATGGSVTAPTILYTDTPTGPTSGGENPLDSVNIGAFLSIFGHNLYSQPSDLGSLTKVYINGVEVANYRVADNAITYTKTGTQRLIVQVGALGGLAVGTPGAIQVIRNGTASSNNDITFTPSGGRVWWVSQAGNDATAAANDMTKAFRHAQTVQQTGNSGSGQNSAGSIGGMSLVVVAGDQVVFRGGNWTDSTGYDNAFFRFRLFSNQGLPNKFIHFTVYPGPIGGNAPEVFNHLPPTGTPPNATGGARYRGGIHGANGNYFGQTGDYFAVSNMHFAENADSSSDAAPFNMQATQYAWWVTNCDAGPWPSTLAPPGNAKGGGVTGHGVGSRWRGNYVHGMQCVGAGENHGFYVDSPEKTLPDIPIDIEISYNWVPDAPGGNAVSLFDNNGSSDGTGTWRGFKGIKVHDNWFSNYAKYGLNVADGCVSVDAWNNVIENGTYAPFRNNSEMSNQAINFFENTVFNCDKVSSGSGNAQVLHTSGPGASGAAGIKNNIFVAGPNTYIGSAPFANVGGSAPTYALAGNIFYGPTQTTEWSAANYPNAGIYSNGIFSNPQFVSTSTPDYSLQAGSPAIDAATATVPTITADFIGTPRPQGAARDIGAFERVSTYPFLSVAPVFSGTERVGSTSTVSQGTWGNGPITQYTYQWATATTNGGALTDITGATAASIAWQITHQGKWPSVKVTATNAVGSTTATVPMGSAVAAHPNAPVNTVQPSITGAGGIGNVLTRVAGTWTPSSGADAPSIAWIWNRDGVAIGGTANAATYTQVTADDSAVINLTETGTNSWGSNSANSSNSITVPHVPSAPSFVGLATPFSSVSGAAVVSVTVQVNDIVQITIATNNNGYFNLAYVDTFNGTSWTDGGGDTALNECIGVMYKRFTTAGTYNVTIPTTGGATFAGVVDIIRGVSTVTPISGTVVTNHGTTVPRNITPSTTVAAKCLIYAAVGTGSIALATSFTNSDTFRAAKSDAGAFRQVNTQYRVTSTAGAQSAMNWSWSGSDLNGAAIAINWAGF